jgi:hypothetical protein
VRVEIPESHEVVLKLPSELPAGEAEGIVLGGGTCGTSGDFEREPFREWLKHTLQGLPPAPAVALEAVRRENLYHYD